VIVVSNTSAILNLAVVGQLSLLEQLYGMVIIPDAVSQELSTVDLQRSVAAEMRIPLWIETQSVTNHQLVNSLLLELDAGEAEAIVLAVELHADLLLLDERRGRKVASRWGLQLIGLLGALVQAKQRGFINTVKPVLDALIGKAGFWVSNDLYARVLQEAGE
jgi:predicted nucleic acid-binding protein